jgi:2-polyprenyl-3-methyl-5-hydroxy-6-metoxy-1,4-benzoquinol methylase
MQISKYLKNNPRNKFLITSKVDKVPIKQVLDKINNNTLGFCIIKIKSKYKILTDGDFRRKSIKDENFIKKNSKEIKFKKLITIDSNETMYNAFRKITKNQISCILVKKNSNIYSYLTLHEIAESLSPERLNLNKKNLENFANLFIKSGMNVLDAACGSGYGSNIISKKAKSVLSLDYSWPAIKFAKENFKSKKISFMKTNIMNFKFNRKFDAIISVETLEHLNKEDGLKWLQNCYKNLNKNGIFICSSPLLRIRNKKPFITNPHHLHELKKTELFLHLKRIFNTKNVNAFIQETDNLKPLTTETEGLCIFVIKKIK